MAVIVISSDWLILTQYPLVKSNSERLPTQPNTGLGDAATPSPTIPVILGFSDIGRTFPMDASSGRERKLIKFAF